MENKETKVYTVNGANGFDWPYILTFYHMQQIHAQM
jgi:hypothetical protein